MGFINWRVLGAGMNADLSTDHSNTEHQQYLMDLLKFADHTVDPQNIWESETAWQGQIQINPFKKEININMTRSFRHDCKAIFNLKSSQKSGTWIHDRFVPSGYVTGMPLTTQMSADIKFDCDVALREAEIVRQNICKSYKWNPKF